MFRRLSLSVMVVAAAACSDSNKKAAGDAGAPDSGTPSTFDAGIDAGPTGPLVFNPGDACESDKQCEGPAATCQTMLAIPSGPMGQGGGMQITFPDGYCTAACQVQDDCGIKAGCGVKELVEILKPLLAASGAAIPPGALDAIPSQCLDRCAGSSECRDGYICQNISDATGLGDQLMLPSLVTSQLSRYCLPDQAPTMDAGLTVDGGSTPDANMSTPDAGHSDAGTTDAGTTDAGTTDAGTTATDAGTTASDAGTTDAGPSDAGTADAGTIIPS